MVITDVSNLSLGEIEKLVENASFAPDLFGSGDWPQQYKKLAVAVHPDKYPDPVEKARAEAIFKKLSLWKTLAESPEVIESSKDSYVLGRELGKGDISTVRIAHSSENIPVVAKIAVNPAVSRLFSNESKVLTAIGQTDQNDLFYRYFPQIRDEFSLPDKRKVTIFDYKPGFFTAEAIKTAYPTGVDGRHLVWMFKRLLTALGAAHSKGYVHGAPVPPHFLYQTEEHGLILVDWTLAVPAGKPILTVPGAFKEWYPPECRSKRPVTPATDIYLAAKAMCYMAGGNPLINSFPESVPSKLKSYLQGCLLESQAMRPQDAWTCVEEVSDAAYLTYGKPKFHVLKMGV